MAACNSAEKSEKTAKLGDVIAEMESDLQQTSPTNHSHDAGLATIMEVLNTERYTYLNVNDPNEHNFWIAIPKQAVNVGDKISYRDGLMKNNFESKEYNRVFETLYLVSKYSIQAADGTSSSSGMVRLSDPDKKISVKPGSGNDLGTLFADPQKWGGKNYTVSGKVVKVNYNIMGINWVHIRDEQFPGIELTITTNEQVAEGDQLTFTGTVTLNKDFGAGYKYDVILENGTVQK